MTILCIICFPVNPLVLTGVLKTNFYPALFIVGWVVWAIGILLALSACSEFLKHVFVFDDDIDIFNPRDVMWAIATRTQWGRDIIIIPRTKQIELDPSVSPNAIGDVGGIDCTKPWGEPYEERVGVDPEVMQRVKLEAFVLPDALAKVNTERI